MHWGLTPISGPLLIAMLAGLALSPWGSVQINNQASSRGIAKQSAGTLSAPDFSRPLTGKGGAFRKSSRRIQSRSPLDAPLVSETESPLGLGIATSPPHQFTLSPFLAQSTNQESINRTETLSFQNIFRMTLNGGECRLDASEKVSGHFSRRRKEPDLHSGMLLCKLVSKKGVLLAEKAVHVPDHVCRVVDPHSTRDEPKAVLFSGLGPQVFQVRFPAHLPGEKLEVYRVTKTHPTTDLSLLLTIPVN